MVHRGEEEVLELEVGVGQAESVEERQGFEELEVSSAAQSNVSHDRADVAHREGVVDVVLQHVVQRLAQKIRHNAVVAVELELVLPTRRASGPLVQVVAVIPVVGIALRDVLGDFRLDFGAFAVATLRSPQRPYRWMARTTFTA